MLPNHSINKDWRAGKQLMGTIKSAIPGREKMGKKKYRKEKRLEQILVNRPSGEWPKNGFIFQEMKRNYSRKNDNLLNEMHPAKTTFFHRKYERGRH